MLDYSKEHTTNWNISDYDMNIILTALAIYASLLEHYDKDLSEYITGLSFRLSRSLSPERVDN